jgi:hypothetical protein
VTDKVAAEDNEVGLQLDHPLGHAAEPAHRNRRTVVQIRDQRDAVAFELRAEAAYREIHLRRLEHRFIPTKKRRGNTLRQPTEWKLGESLETWSSALARRRATSRVQEE